MSIAPRVHIALTPSMLEVAVVTPMGVSASAAAALSPDQWETLWEGRLTGLDDTLRELLGRVGARGKFRTRIFYTSPDALTDAHTVPGTGETALHAAELALRDRVSFDPNRNPLSVSVVCRDGVDTGKSHALLAADTDENCEIVGTLVERCGGVVTQITPITAPVLAHLVREATEDKEQRPKARVFIGEHAAMIVGSEGGRLIFARTIGIGFGLLVDGFHKAAAPKDEMSPTADRSAARVALFECGIPESSTEVIPLGKGVQGSAILPALQPVIQRYFVELRQTLRFGFGESNLQRVRIELIGLGAGIPRFAKKLAGMLEMEIHTPDAERASDPMMGCAEGGELYIASRHSPTAINLMPTAIVNRKRRTNMGISLRLGAAAAVAIVCADAALTWSRTRDIREDMAKNQARIEFVKLETERWKEAVRLSEELVEVKQAFVEAVGDRADWTLMLQEIARQTRHPVRLTEVTSRNAGDRTSVVIKGFAFDESDLSGSDALGFYIERLTRTPVTGSVSIGSTQRAEIDGRSGVKFSLEAEAVGIPLANAEFGAIGGEQ